MHYATNMLTHADPLGSSLRYLRRHNKQPANAWARRTNSSSPCQGAAASATRQRPSGRTDLARPGKRPSGARHRRLNPGDSPALAQIARPGPTGRSTMRSCHSRSPTTPPHPPAAAWPTQQDAQGRSTPSGRRGDLSVASHRLATTHRIPTGPLHHRKPRGRRPSSIRRWPSGRVPGASASPKAIGSPQASPRCIGLLAEPRALPTFRVFRRSGSQAHCSR